jgi:hypothetical protein
MSFVDVGKELLENDMPAELASTVMLYSDNSETKEEKIQDYINKDKIRILKQWCSKIGVKNRWCDIDQNQYKYIWDVYTHRKSDNYPDVDYIKQLDKGNSNVLQRGYFEKEDVKDDIINPFDPYLFYSKQHTVKITPEMERQLDEITEDEYFEIFPVDIIYEWVKELMNITQLRCGDVVWLQTSQYYTRYRNEYVVMWNGEKLVNLDILVDDYGAVAREFDVAQFPTVNYFYYTIVHNHCIWLCNNIQIKETIRLNFGIIKTIRKDGIIIYSYTGDNSISPSKYNTIKDFQQYYTTHEKILCEHDIESYTDNIGNDDDVCDMVCNDYYKEQKNTSRILFALLIEAH